MDEFDELVSEAAPFLYEDEKYSTIVKLLRQWLSSPKRKLKIKDDREALINQTKELVERAIKQTSIDQSSEGGDLVTRTEIPKENVIWRELKAELFELLLIVIGDYGITLYEFNHSLQAALSVLQIKETQYRRLPKEALEKVLDDFLPSAEGGRSLVRFIVTELSRLRGDNYSYQRPNNDQQPMVVNDDMSKRAVKIVALTIAELAQRQLVPIPSTSMLDDDVTKEATDIPKDMVGDTKQKADDNTKKQEEKQEEQIQQNEEEELYISPRKNNLVAFAESVLNDDFALKTSHKDP